MKAENSGIPEIPEERHLGIRIFGYCINKLWLLVASTIILVALIHIVLGLALPRINIYQQEIIDWVKSEYDLTIEVSNISSEWSIQGPSLALQNLKVKSEDGQYNILELERVSVNFDMISSIIDGRLSTENITMIGADIQFYINRTLGVDIIDNSSEEESSSLDLEDASHRLFDILFGQKKITLVDSNLSLYTLAGTEFRYRIDEIDVTKYGEIHQLSGRLSYSGGGQISIISEVYGDPTAKDSYSEVYLEGSSIDVANLPWVNMESKLRPKSGELSWQFWGTWKEKHWDSAKAIVDLNNAGWSNDSEKDNHLSSMISWEHKVLEQGYMAVHGFEISVDGESRSVAESYLNFQRDQNQQVYWDLFVTDMDILPLVSYSQDILDDSSDLAQFLKSAELQSSVKQLNLRLFKNQDYWQPLQLNMKFTDLRFSSWSGLPETNRLNGILNFSKDSGRLKFESNNSDIGFTELFRHAIHADRLTGDVKWQRNDHEDFRFEIRDLSLVNKDLMMQSRGAFFFQDKQPILNLYAEVIDANAANKSLYLPVGVMTENLVSYLDGSIKSGTLSIAKSIVRGPISSFPFDSLDGTFVAYGEVNKANYQYLPDWPIANNLNAELLFEGSLMDISATTGNSLENRVIFASAFAKDLSIENPILNLKLDVISQNNSGKTFLKASPLNSISKAIDPIDYQGKIRTKIDIGIGLGQQNDIKLKGHVKLEPKNSLLTTSVISVENLDGKINFDHNGITESKVSVEYLNRKLELVLQGNDNQNEPILSIDAKGMIPAKGIAHFIGSQWLPFFQGESSFSSLIQFSPVDKPDATRVFFQTDFEGMKIDFPDMFGKKKEETSEVFLTLDIDTISTGEIKWKGISGNWYWRNIVGNSEDAQNLDKKAFDYGGDFFLNQAESIIEERRSGLRVSGNLEQVYLPEWLKFIGKLDKNKDKDKNKNEMAELDNSNDSFDLFFDSIDLKVEKLNTEITNVNEVKIELNKIPKQPWSILFNSELLNGNLVLNDLYPWELNISDANLSLNTVPLADRAAENKSNFRISPLDFSAMNIKCGRCIVDQVDYGELLLEIRELPMGISLSGDLKKGSGHDISLTGTWQETVNALTETQVLFDFSSNNVGSFLDQWNVDATVEDSAARLFGNTWWEGAPWEIDYTQLDGDFQLSLGKGYLSEISDGQGRLFSLFNLQSILRKLTFDFKDVYKKGFFYDTITGTIQMRDGVISTENIEIEGNVADVKLYGQTDLKNKTIDQTAVITPHLTSSFPVLAAWAVEPTTGLLVFLLDKIMEPAVEVATRLDYQISGTFDEVKVEEVKRSKKKIKVEYSSEIQQGDESKNKQDDQLLEDGQKPTTAVDNKNNLKENMVDKPVDDSLLSSTQTELTESVQSPNSKSTQEVSKPIDMTPVQNNEYQSKPKGEQSPQINQENEEKKKKNEPVPVPKSLHQAGIVKNESLLVA